MTEVLAELSAALRRIAGAAAPSVVGVGAGGSGVVVEAGLVLTNAHNLRHEETVATLRGGERVVATVAGSDLEGDLAVLSVPGADQPLAWATEGPVVGDAVVALADPGGRGLRASLGFVTALEVTFGGPGGSRIAGALEHSAPLPRGSSGGPLVDAGGRLVGIDTHREGDGFYLAVPADAELRGRFEALSRGEKPRRPRLGVALAPPAVARRLRQAVGLPARDGLLVRGVEQGGPADRAGMRQGDLLVSAAGSPLASVDDLAAALVAAGTATVEIGLVRGSEELTLAVDLGTAA